MNPFFKYGPFALLVFGMLALGGTHSYADEEPPTAEAPPISAPSIKLPKRGSFYFSLMDPYPASFGIGITHFMNEYFAFALGVGKGDVTTYAVGFRFRPAARKLSPLVGLNLSYGAESVTCSRGFLYATTGLDWKWDSGILIHFGIDWGLTPRLGKTEMKPYLQFGFAY